MKERPLSATLIEDHDVMTEVRHIALFSGGNDSLVATHYAHKHFPIDDVMYLDTNSGLPENLEYVKETCEREGWNLRVESSPKTMEDFIKNYGFPGPGTHSWAYGYFKQRQLRAVAKQYDEVIYYSGVRARESERRSRLANGLYQKSDGGKWLWVRPVWHFNDDQCADYIAEHDLETNPTYETIDRSGDCFCGAFVHRYTELGALQEHHPDHYEFIMDLEKKAEEWDVPENRPFWGFCGLSEAELRSEIAKNDESQMELCASCDVGFR